MNYLTPIITFVKAAFISKRGYRKAATLAGRSFIAMAAAAAIENISYRITKKLIN